MRDVFMSFKVSSPEMIDGIGNIVFKIEDDERVTEEIITHVEESTRMKAAKEYGGKPEDYQVIVINVCYL